MNTSFADILNAAPTEIVYPEPLPNGSYQVQVQGQPVFGKAKSGTDSVTFNLLLVNPMEDVDTDAFEKFGGRENLQGKTQRLTFYVTPASIFRLDEFLYQTLGIEFGTRRDQAIAQSANRSFVATMEQKAGNNGKFYTEVTRTAAL